MRIITTVLALQLRRDRLSLPLKDDVIYVNGKVYKIALRQAEIMAEMERLALRQAEIMAEMERLDSRLLKIAKDC